MIIPMVEKAKLIGTWEMYSSEIEGEISYAKDGGVNGKITVHEDYTVDSYNSCPKGWNDFLESPETYLKRMLTIRNTEFKSFTKKTVPE